MTFAVWVSNLLMQMTKLFGFACTSTEGGPEAYLANIYHYDIGQPVPEGFLPDVMWTSDSADDRLYGSCTSRECMGVLSSGPPGFALVGEEG